MVRRSSVPAALFNERINFSSDWLFWMETLLRGGIDNPGAGIVPGIFARHRRHGGNVTRQAHSYGLEENLVALDILADRAPSLQGKITNARSERIATAGFQRMLAGNIAGGGRMVFQASWVSLEGVGRSILNGLSYAAVSRRKRKSLE